MQSWAIGRSTHVDGNRQNDLRRSCRAGNSRMGRPNCPHTTKRSSLWLCTDHRKLNAVRIRDSELLSKMDKLVKSLADPGLVLTLYTNLRYWPAKFDEWDHKNRVYKSLWLVSFFLGAIWSNNILAFFEMAMDVIAWSVNSQSTPLYLHNIFVFSKSVLDQLTHLRRVLTVPQNAGLALKSIRLLPCKDNRLPGSRCTTERVEGRGNNDKSDYRITISYITDGSVIL